MVRFYSVVFLLLFSYCCSAQLGIITNIKKTQSYPEWYGAVGDGLSDDTQGLQKTIDSSKVLILSAGKTYRITDKLVLKDSCLIIGNGAKIRQSSAQKQILYALNIKNILIEGVEFEGNGGDYFSNYNSLAIGCDLQGSSDVKIDNCKFLNITGRSISIVNGDYITINSNILRSASFTNTGQFTALVGLFGVSNFSVSNNKTFGGGTAIATANVKNGVITANIIDSTYHEHGFYIDQFSQNLSVFGNVVSNLGTLGNGLKLQINDELVSINPNNINISNNVFLRTGSSGILVTNTSSVPLRRFENINISNNVIKLSGADGIYVLCTKNSKLLNNVIDSAGRDGISLNITEFLAVENNTINSTSQNGIQVLFSENTKISENTIINPCFGLIGGNRNGILVQASSTGTRIERNYVYSNNISMLYGYLTAANLSTYHIRDNVHEGNGDAFRHVVGNSNVAKVYQGNVFDGAVINQPTITNF